MALRQLVATAEAAAKLAEVAHVQAITAQGGGAEKGRGDTEGLRPGTGGVGRRS